MKARSGGDKPGIDWDPLLVPPEEATEPGRAFIEEIWSTILFVRFIARIATTGDYIAHSLRDILNSPADAEPTPKYDSASELATQDPGPATVTLRKNAQAMLEMAVTRIVDRYQGYLADVIRAALKARPEVLRSREQVTLEEILQYESIDDLHAALVERKVTDLSYAGLDELEQWCCDRMGLDLAPDNETREAIAELIETRNLIVHNRGRIGNRYLRRVSGTKFQLGDIRELEVDYLFRCAGLLMASFKSVDHTLACKFGLPREAYVPQNGETDEDGKQTNDVTAENGRE